MSEPIKADAKRREDGTFGPGNSANPAGRPKGSTLKEFQAAEFRDMSDKEKKEWLKSVSKDKKWVMAEGSPHQTTDLKAEVTPIPIANVFNNTSNKENSETE